MAVSFRVQITKEIYWRQKKSPELIYFSSERQSNVPQITIWKWRVFCLSFGYLL